MKNTLWLFAFLLIITSCTEDEPTIGETGAKMNFQFKFDPTQERLNGFGEPSTIPSNHAAQNPDFNSMSGFYIELVPTKFTQIGEGAVVIVS